MNTNTNGQGSNELVAGIRKAQQARYAREDYSLLEALRQSNAYLSAQYNLEENN